MDRLIFIDTVDVVSRLLTDHERKVLDGLELSLCMDPESSHIYHGVLCSQPASVETIEQQKHVIRKLIDSLHHDKEIFRS